MQEFLKKLKYRETWVQIAGVATVLTPMAVMVGKMSGFDLDAVALEEQVATAIAGLSTIAVGARTQVARAGQRLEEEKIKNETEETILEEVDSL